MVPLVFSWEDMVYVFQKECKFWICLTREQFFSWPQFFPGFRKVSLHDSFNLCLWMARWIRSQTVNELMQWFPWQNHTFLNSVQTFRNSAMIFRLVLCTQCFPETFDDVMYSEWFLCNFTREHSSKIVLQFVDTVFWWLSTSAHIFI